MEYVLLGLVVIACVAFALLNGMNDLSGMVATLISTRALPARAAQVVAIIGVWIGASLTGAVAKTVATGLVDLKDYAHAPALSVWLGGITGAVLWGLLARKLGIPTSATHAFVGSLCGAAVAGTMKPSLVQWGFAEFSHEFLSHPNPKHLHGVMKVLAGLICSPIIGGGLGFLLYRFSALALRRATLAVNAKIRRLEVLAVLSQSFNYGFNDAQKVMGVLSGALIAAGMMTRDPAQFALPLWVKIITAVAVAGGALIGSSKIIRTMGRGLFHVYPAEALSGQVAATVAVFGGSLIGAPVSSSQCTSSALVGVGGAWRPRHVRWKKVKEILMTWVVTFPCAALIGAVVTFLAQLVPGVK